MPEPIAISIHATNVQPEITSGAVLPGCRTDKRRCGFTVERLAREPLS